MKDWSWVFLAELSVTLSVTAAAKAADVSRRMVYKRKETDPEFAAAWEDAYESAIDSLVQRCYERAIDKSDQLAMFLLRSHRSVLYRETLKTENVTHVRADVNLEPPSPEYVAEVMALLAQYEPHRFNGHSENGQSALVPPPALPETGDVPGPDGS